MRRPARALGGAIKRIRIKRLRSIVAPADLLTLGNALSGFMAIIVLTGVARIYEPPFFPGLERVWPAVADDRFLLATILVGLGVICDALDGVVARHFGGSRLGGDLDTLADAVTFVLVPAFMILASYGDEAPFRAFLVSGLVVFMGILRLARFNSNPIETETKTFQGLPTPWMGMTVTLMALTQVPLTFGLPFAAALAFLMMSNVAYPKSKGRTRYATYLMITSGLVTIGLLIFFPENQSRVIRTLFVLVALTLAIAPLLIAHRQRQQRRRNAEEHAPDEEREPRPARKTGP